MFVQYVLSSMPSQAALNFSIGVINNIIIIWVCSLSVYLLNLISYQYYGYHATKLLQISAIQNFHESNIH